MVIFHLEVRELFLYPGESKVLRQRLLEKFVPWEDGSSSTVEVKNKKKRRKVKRTAVSDAVKIEDGNVNLSDVKKKKNLKLHLQKE